MNNPMKIKRRLLKEFLLGVLHAFNPDYTLETRLRKATFNQDSRNDRIALMGEDYSYGEVLHRMMPTPEGQRSAGSTSRNRHHNFEVFLWLKYEDGPSLETSSQDTWDDIIESDSGVLQSLENKPYLQDENGNQYVLSKPEDISAYEVVMDTGPLELAHYLNFQIEVRG